LISSNYKALNDWRYRFSISQLLDLNGNNYAEDGVPADIEAAFD